MHRRAGAKSRRKAEVRRRNIAGRSPFSLLCRVPVANFSHFAQDHGHECFRLAQAPSVILSAARDAAKLPTRLAGQGLDCRPFRLHRLDSVGDRLCRTGASAADYRALRGTGSGRRLCPVFEFAARHRRAGCRDRPAGGFGDSAPGRRRSGAPRRPGCSSEHPVRCRVAARGTPKTGRHRRSAVATGADRLPQRRIAGPDRHAAGQDVRHQNRRRGIFRGRIHGVRQTSPDPGADFRTWSTADRAAGLTPTLAAADSGCTGRLRGGDCRDLRFRPRQPRHCAGWRSSFGPAAAEHSGVPLGRCRGAGAGSGGHRLPGVFGWHSSGADLCRKEWLRGESEPRTGRPGLGEHTCRGLAGVSGIRQPVAHLDRRFSRRPDAGRTTDTGAGTAGIPVFPDGPDRAAAQGRAGRDPDRYRRRHAGSGVPEAPLHDRSRRVRHCRRGDPGDPDRRRGTGDHSGLAAVADHGADRYLAAA